MCGSSQEHNSALKSALEKNAYKQPCSAASALIAYRGDSFSFFLHRKSHWAFKGGWALPGCSFVIYSQNRLATCKDLAGEDISEGRDFLL